MKPRRLLDDSLEAFGGWLFKGDRTMSISEGLRGLNVSRFGKDGWFFATDPSVPGLTLFAPTLEELVSRREGATALVLKAQRDDLQAAVADYSHSWHVAVV